jgi:hypothetical protein
MNWGMLGQAVVAAIIIAVIIDKVFKPLFEAASLPAGERWPAVAKLWPFYTALIVGAALAWFTGLQIFTLFEAAPVVGRILTCLVIGLGPSVLHDLGQAVLDGLSNLPKANSGDG